MDLDLIGKVLGWTTAGTVALTGVWTYLGKSKDSAWSRLVSENDRVRKDLQEMKTDLKNTTERVQRLETEVVELRADRRQLVEFLQDVASGRYELDAAKLRAHELLARMGIGGTA